jgi:SAM-dependent methyltransferase
MTENKTGNCRLCGSTKTDEPIQLKEMMFGTRAVFDYFRCQECDTLQIASIPEDLGQYYPSDYYSFTPPALTLRQKIRSIFKPEPKPEWLTGVSTKSTVLDIGSGGGQLLHQMHSWGFRSLIGYDPFLGECCDLPNGIKLTNIEPSGLFDIVMMHHALEHVPDPAVSLQTARQFMKPGGRVVIRIPVRQGYAWRNYGKDWAHLDPPRHLYHWTVKGFTEFAGRNGLNVTDWAFDGALFSLVYSPLFAQDIAMKGDRSEGPVLTAEKKAELNKQAALLNEAGDGDCAWFVLERAEFDGGG